MRTKFKINLFIIIVAILISMIAPTKVQAAGGFSLNKYSASLTTGGTTTITITATNCAGQFSISSSNTSVATVSTSSVWLDNSSTTVTITSKSAGTANINIKAVDVTDTELNDITGTKTCKVTVSAPASSSGSSSSGSTGSSGTSKPNNSTTSKPQTPTVVKSNNSKLGSLKIAEGTITPEFNSGTKEYNISVPNEITKLSISAIADSSKATIKINGNEELQVGENNIEIVVTAEDGSKTTYKILAKRAEPELSLQGLTVAYVNENSERTELLLNPQFTFNIYEYNIDTTLPHTVKNLEINAVANREGSKVEVLDNEELKTGENRVTIKVTITDEAGLEEQKTYIITVNKEAEPVVTPLTIFEKIKRWFSGAGATITSWTSENINKIITGMLVVATVSFVGLTIYFAYDYKNYQKLLAKLAEYNKENLNKRANIALNPENVNVEDIEEVETNIEEMGEDSKKIKAGRGKRFK